MLYYDKKNVPLARQLRKNMTPWENKLWYQFLRTFTPRFQRQKPIGGYIADFYCAKTRLSSNWTGHSITRPSNSRPTVCAQSFSHRTISGFCGSPIWA